MKTSYSSIRRQIGFWLLPLFYLIMPTISFAAQSGQMLTLGGIRLEFIPFAFTLLGVALSSMYPEAHWVRQGWHVPVVYVVVFFVMLAAAGWSPKKSYKTEVNSVKEPQISVAATMEN